MANTFKNEFDIDFGDKKLLLRATFNCLVNIEDRCNKSFIELTEALAAGKLRFNDVFIILSEGLKGANVKMDDEELQELIRSVGLLPVTLQLEQFMHIAISGGSALEEIQKYSDSEISEPDPNKKKS